MKRIMGLFVAAILWIGFVTPVVAEETVLELSLEDATKMALAHSTSLISQTLSTELAQEKMDDISLVEVGDYSKSELLSYLQQAASYANSQLSRQVKEESVKYALKKAYINVINQERENALEKMNLQITNKELQVTRVKAELGLLSEAQWQSQQLAYENSVKQLKDNQAALESAYRSLSVLIGKDENTQYSLSLEPEYEKLELTLTLPGYINNKIATDLNVQQQVRNVSTADSQERLTRVIDTGSAYADQEARNSLITAELTLADTKTQLRNSLLSCYDSILALETNIALNQKELETLKQNLAIAQTKFAQQTGTQLEMDKAEAEVLAKESDITSQIYEHMLLMEQFDKSYLL